MLTKIGFQTIARTGLIVLMIAILAGCGFHLRGLDSNGALAFQTAQIESANGVRPEVQLALQRQMRQANVTVLDSQAAEVQIQLSATQFESSRTSARLGDATSELIRMTQPFKAIDLTSGQEITSGKSSVYRDRQINTAVALASDSELRSIQKSMSEEIARQIVDRVRRTMSNASANPITPATSVDQ